MKCLAILLAGGSSERFGEEDKLWINLGGKPLWEWAYQALSQHPLVADIGIVAHPSRIKAFSESGVKARFIIPGGNTREESAYNGLKASSEEDEFILIHDAARPYVSQALITSLIKAAKLSGAAFPGVPPKDTIKLRTPEGIQTLVRDALICTQTPQVALRRLLLHVHENRKDMQKIATDDMSLLESIGVSPEVIPGDSKNIKITTPEDFVFLKAMLETELDVRTGLGYDIHSFSEDPERPLLLGGVRFEWHQGLEGHSDADVVLHAVVDALLGAAGLGDIGQHYPNTDPRWKNASSLIFLGETGTALKEAGWQILNIDISVVAEQPKILHRRNDICSMIAKHLDMEASRVNLKATTNEKLGAIGRSEGIAAFAIATLKKTKYKGIID